MKTWVWSLLQLLLLCACSSEVEELEAPTPPDSGVYQRSRQWLGPDWNVGVYTFCDEADPAIRGECSGAPTIVERIETINTGRGHMYCYFERSPGAVLRADVWCQGSVSSTDESAR